MLNTSDNDYVWLFVGKKAQEYEDLVDNVLNTTKILKCSHPASAAYAKEKEWDCGNVFNGVNYFLNQEQKLPLIIW